MALFAGLASCKKENGEIITTEMTKVLSQDINVFVKGKTKEQSLYQWSETYNFLGFGYDVTDTYNDEVSVRANIIDIPAYAASGANRINFRRGTEGSWNTIIATDAVNLSEQFSNSAKDTRGLSVYGNTIERAFPGAAAHNKKYVYGYYSNYMVWKRYRFHYSHAVNNFLTAGFENDLTTLSAEALVHKYGTHVLTRIKLGSKFDVVFQAEAPVDSRQQTSMEGLRYALKRTFGLMSGHLDDVNLKNLNANSSAQILFSSVGGDASQLKIETIKDRTMLNITNWSATRTEDRARFIGIEDDGLVSLDNFIDDSVKKAEVKTFIAQYFVDKAAKLIH